jgi:hypothetical protein
MRELESNINRHELIIERESVKLSVKEKYLKNVMKREIHDGATSSSNILWFEDINEIYEPAHLTIYTFYQQAPTEPHTRNTNSIFSPWRNTKAIQNLLVIHHAMFVIVSMHFH